MTQWFKNSVASISSDSIEKARYHQSLLTKPPGALGRLEIIAEQFSGWQGTQHPVLDHINIAVFAGDHGVCQQGVSAFPQAVTEQMVINFLEGGAAISVLSTELGANFSVINMGIVSPLSADYHQHPHLINYDVAAGTADFSSKPAMTEEQVAKSLIAGQKYVDSLPITHLFIGGEMGIGNTTSASAIYAAMLSLTAEEVTGPGTGVSGESLLRKQQVIEKALLLHQDYLKDPYQVLRCLGGLEIAGLVGAYIAAAQRGIPILVDGFICTAAALIATGLNAGVSDWLLYSHQSAEPAHKLALQRLNVEPLLSLDMRLGEGSGAALALPILRCALALHNRMSTFQQAGVTNKQEAIDEVNDYDD